ncbi:hypothetical protein OSB04_020648 [Centaurea solstitialis]|uniref:Reverse transcriptase domain-containing protein n=1 Tax=Centaurea solstitialis TaxID=347529 RepID=A0AA38WDG8_9ASTR|nr:hypothetical protein OSB04_020648 [Centaurea solstitialis]
MLKSIDSSLIKAFWGNQAVDFEALDARGKSGGIILTWNPTFFQKMFCIKGDYFLVVWGNWTGKDTLCGFINVYAPHSASKKKELWSKLLDVITTHKEVAWVIFGDFNEVRRPEERKGTVFTYSGAKAFNEFIHNGGLSEIRSGGRNFTRYSKDGSKLSKLDRFLVTNNFAGLWPNCFVNILPRGLSDHCPLLLDSAVADFGPSYFKFFNSWLLNPSLKAVVSNTWESSVLPKNLSPIQRFMAKLRLLKKKIKEWRISENNSKNRDKKFWLDNITKLDLKAESGSLSVVERKERSMLELKLLEAEKAEIMDLKQKSRVRWAIEGDDNSKLFHGVIRHHIRKNFIHGISVNGVWVTDPATMGEETLSFFSKKFKEVSARRPTFHSSKFKKLSPAQKSFLEESITEKEIRDAIWDCGGDKAPGPDGFSFKFLRAFWEIIKDDLISAVKWFESGGELLSGSNASFICLIPKCDNHVSLSEYRPISLIGCLYKVIAKILATRLKAVISSVVSNVQSAYIAGRSILDDKAFDSVKWEYLDELLDSMNFGAKWRSWIRSCLNSVSVSILLNGAPTKEFKPNIGVRQGDPLAPFLFILAAEGLHVAMTEAVEKGVFTGVQLPNGGPIVSHLLYADDVIFIGEWSKFNARNLLRVLRCFHLSSGLKVNWNKSNILGVGVDEFEVDAVANTINCNVGSLPLSYLGLPIGVKMNRFEHWSPIINKFQRRLCNWKAATLSAGGRLTLCKSVLGSLSLYYFSLFKAPAKVTNVLESTRLRFFWGMKENERKIAWVAWKKVCADFGSGGLGIGSLKAQNIALLAKWWWRFFNTAEGSLWKSVIQAFHGPMGGLVGSTNSGKFAGLWKNIIKIQTDLLKATIPIRGWFQCNIGSNSCFHFWKDVWTLNGALKNRFPRLYRLDSNKDCFIKDRLLFDGDNRCSGCSVSWKRPPSTPDEVSDWNNLISVCISSGVTGDPEKWRWALVSSGTFSVRSLREAYDDLNSKRYSHLPFCWFKVIPGKVNMVVWRISHKSLPTLVNLQKKGVQLASTTCALCGEEDETEDHIFGSCNYFKKQLLDFCSWWNVSIPTTNLGYLLKWGEELRLTGDKEKAFMGTFYVLIWLIWNHRNNIIFRSKGETHQGKLQALSFFWIKNRWGKKNFADWTNWCTDPFNTFL